MTQHIVLLLETLLILYCFHVINERKIRLNIGIILFVLGNILFWEVKNVFPEDRLSDCIAYVIYFALDMYYFNNIWKKALVDVVLSILFVVSCQMIGMVTVNVIGIQGDNLLLMGNIIACIVAWFILPRLKMQSLYTALVQGIPYIGIIMSVFIVELCLALIQRRNQHGLQLEVYVFTVPILFGVTGIVVKLLQKSDETEEIKAELAMTNTMHYRYEKLLDNVRIRQHGFNNQITAILGMHYVYKTYEELVKNQQDLCRIAMNDNKFNKLLWLRNDVLAGFLFQKLKEIEEVGVDIDLEVISTEFFLPVPIQYTIEMIGILLDNAYESVTTLQTKQIIKIIFLRDENLLILSILNPSPYIEYNDINKMFIRGVSSKGEGRGIGLFRISEICEKYGCDILCENVNDQNMNWIKFSIIAEKAER